jgi:hypothetical protein
MSVAKQRQKEWILFARRHGVLRADVHALVPHRKYVLVDGIHATAVESQPSVTWCTLALVAGQQREVLARAIKLDVNTF